MVHRVTVLLDNNVWRYLVDAHAIELLRKVAKANRVGIVACPAIVYECLRTGDPQLRRAFAKALTKPDWQRPMPEAFVEAEDLRRAIASLRPDWVVDEPDLRNWTKNRSDWQGGFWRRIRTDPSRMSKIISHLGDDTLARARIESRQRRDEARTASHTVSTLTLDEARAWYSYPEPGWNGEPFEAWRGASELRWWRDLVVSPRQTTLDWLGPWLDVGRIRSDRESWVAFWTRDVSPERLPREWLHWAMAEAQALRKTSPGTPVDNQITAYLPDYDFFVTADRPFAQCVDLIREYSPSPLAQVSISPAGPDAIRHLFNLIETART